MASSSSSRIKNYDVFLSFRGEDTRKTIVSHLDKALRTRGICTFKDDRNLEMGENISDNLCKAIQNSRLAVVVISENYATSGWCLDELELIMKLVDKKEIEVVPIFYGVHPSVVRHQQGSFDLKKFYGSSRWKKVSEWGEVLQRIASTKGKDFTNFKDDEATMTEDIVQHVSSRLIFMLPIDRDNVFGMEAHMEHLRPLLDMETKNDEVRMIGIWGMGGVGKTSIAKYLYETLKHQFSPHYCFINSVRMTSTKHGLLYLQEQLLSTITGEEFSKLYSLERGADIIKSRFINLKVFLVLDDVDDGIQLSALAKDARWFGPGSRIIITTRDKGLLYSCGYVYNVKCLDNHTAIQLFQHVAFQGGGGGNPPSHVHNDLSNRVSRISQGLPLAIEAFGCYFRGKSLVEWQDALNSFEGAPLENIMNILRISYDGLDEICKTTFLHVACLFNGDNVWRVINLLSRGEFGIKVLTEKSLINISADGCIAMHALVEQTGRKIVRQESGNTPAEQRILWHHKDIYPVLVFNAGTTKTEGVAVDVSTMPNSFYIEWNVFKPMHNLNFLNVYKEDTEGSKSLLPDAENLLVPRELRLLHWDAYPYTSLPSSLDLKHLVELNMCHSKLITLWSGTPKLLNLRRLNLSQSKILRELPYLIEAACLEELILEGCSSLKQIHNSDYFTYRLKKLDLSNCDRLKDIQIKVEGSVVSRVRSVQLYVLDSEKPFGVRSVDDSFAYMSIKGLLKIEFGNLRGHAEHLCFSSVQETPLELMILEQQTARRTSHPYGFKTLDIKRSNYSTKCVSFKCYNFSDVPWLVELSLINLNIEEIPDDIDSMQMLEKLDLSGNDFKGLPTSMIQLSKLKHVTMCNCRNLEALPELYQVETLILFDCTNLRALVSIPSAEQEQGRYSLLELWLDNCNNVESLSDQLRQFTKLTYLDISRHDFETVPTSIKDLTSLVTLCVNYCKKLKYLTEIPLSVKYIYAHGCKSLQTSSFPIDGRDLFHCAGITSQPWSFLLDFSSGSSEEVPMCACVHNTKTLTTHIQIKSLVSNFMHRLKPWW